MGRRLGPPREGRRAVQRGEEIALATVVWRQGPSSGQQGSRAIVTAGGEVHGWIGGACAEPVVIREAQRVIQEREPKLLLLGTPEQFGAAVPDGITVIPIACQSEGALEVYIEPVVPTLQLVVVGTSPMAHTLGDLAAALGWRSEVLDGRGVLRRRRRRTHARRRRDAGARRRGGGRAGGAGQPRPSSAWSPRGAAATPCSATSRSAAFHADCSTGCTFPSGSTWGTPRTARSRSRSSPSSSSCVPQGAWLPPARPATRQWRRRRQRRSTRCAG